MRYLLKQNILYVKEYPRINKKDEYADKFNENSL